MENFTVIIFIMSMFSALIVNGFDQSKSACPDLSGFARFGGGEI